MVLALAGLSTTTTFIRWLCFRAPRATAPVRRARKVGLRFFACQPDRRGGIVIGSDGSSRGRRQAVRSGGGHHAAGKQFGATGEIELHQRREYRRGRGAGGADQFVARDRRGGEQGRQLLAQFAPLVLRQAVRRAAERRGFAGGEAREGLQGPPYVLSGL